MSVPHPKKKVNQALKLRRQGVAVKEIAALTQTSEGFLWKLFQQNKIKLNKKEKIKKATNQIFGKMLSYSTEEQKIKIALEKEYGLSFKKEAFDGCIIEYACATHLISFSTYKNALNDYYVPKKWAVVSSLEDNRNRIAYIKSNNNKVTERLTRLNVTVKNCSDLAVNNGKDS